MYEDVDAALAILEAVLDVANEHGKAGRYAEAAAALPLIDYSLNEVAKLHAENVGTLPPGLRAAAAEAFRDLHEDVERMRQVLKPWTPTG